VKEINREHPEYQVQRGVWRAYRDLYAGGEQLKSRAADYLLSRQREPAQVYQERLNRVFYENYVGSIVDWYSATLFRREPVISFDGANTRGRQFFSTFIDDCDLKGTSLTDFYRKVFIDALVCGSGYVLVDFPKFDGAASNRAEEDLTGVSRAYLVSVRPEELINWSKDERGNFEWIVLRSERLKQRHPDDSEWVKQTKWTYYDRHSYQVWEATDSGQPAALIAEGRHGLAKQGRVPLFSMELSEGLWLLNKAGLLQLEHFNKSNALSWALTMGLFAMPVVFTEKQFDQMMGESYYLQLGKDDRFGWTEPDGHVFQIAADNLVRLQEEIYRVCYVAQAGGSLSGNTPQSGLSKQRDHSITQEVLRAYGDVVKDSMKRVLRAVESAREDKLAVTVSGLDEFDIGDFSSELADAERLMRLGTGSPTLEREILKKLALKYLSDARQDIKEQITREIDLARQE
jgi:hypothetical protein